MKRINEAFTRRHYEIIAELINDTLADVEEATGGNKDAIDAIQELATRLATVFANDNRLFDKGRFLRACGIK